MRRRAVYGAFAFDFGITQCGDDAPPTRTTPSEPLMRRGEPFTAEQKLFIRMRNALANFLENPQFVVSVGGNPIVVDSFLDDARRVLKLAQEIDAPQGASQPTPPPEDGR